MQIDAYLLQIKEDYLRFHKFVKDLPYICKGKIYKFYFYKELHYNHFFRTQP